MVAKHPFGFGEASVNRRFHSCGPPHDMWATFTYPSSLPAGLRTGSTVRSTTKRSGQLSTQVNKTLRDFIVHIFHSPPFPFP